MSYLLSELNAEQLKPVLDTEGAVLVTAGAGSGKTRLLTHRIAYLVQEKGVSPYNILAITFTNKAAGEMRERLENMLGAESDRMLISTFHSMCLRILRMFIANIGYSKNFSVYGEEEKERVVKGIIKAHDYEQEELLKKALWGISDAKNKCLTPEEYINDCTYYEYADEICQIYSEYQRELYKNNALDFDDLLTVTLRLLRENKEALEYCRNRFKYIHVDEFQDTNSVQYELLLIMATKSGNIFAVGDEDQSIYGWRGANFENIFNFKKDFDNCKVYKLERNYRSTKNILNAANKLIKHNTARLDKTLWTESGEGAPIELLRASSEADEALGVVSSIIGLVRNGYCRYSDIAVLMRVNALSRSFEEKLLSYGIPHKVFGGFKFYDRKEIKDLLAYLKLLGNPADDEAIVRIINFPKRGIGDGTVTQLRNYAAVTGCNLSDVILNIESNEELPLSVIKKTAEFSKLLRALYKKKNESSISGLVSYLISVLNLNAVYGDDSEESRDRIMHINEFLSSVNEFENSNEGADLSDYLQMVSLYSDSDEMDGSDYVTLATVHSAKGLEFKVVYVVGLEEGIFPLIRLDFDDEQEERRLCYVAFTRAKERLFLTTAYSRFLYGQRKAMQPSRFLREAGIISGYSEYGGKAFRGEYSSGDYYNRGGSYDNYQSKIAHKPVTQRPTDVPKKQQKDTSQFKEGAIVEHPKFGRGKIIALTQEHNGAYAQVHFDKVGKITLALEYAPIKTVSEENANG